MTSPIKPESTPGKEASFEQSSSKGFLDRHRYRWIALIVGFVALSAVVWIRGNAPQPADRPRVTVQQTTIVGPLVQHNIPTATVFLKNSGQSPALMTKARLVMTVWTADTFPAWDMPLKLGADVHDFGEINPGSVVSRTISLIMPLTDVQGMHLERKDWFIVILGIMSYVDTFGKPHQTTLCLIWRDTSQDNLSPCERWNEAD